MYRPFQDYSLDRLREVLANYEQRMVDSGSNMTIVTARLLSGSMREIHAEIGRRLKAEKEGKRG